jgi:aspartate aminotransferase
LQPLSKRILSLSPSPTVALNAKAKALKADGIDVLNFAVGEPDFSTPKEIIDRGVRALQAGRTKYGPAGGGLPFRQAVIDKLKKDNSLDFDPSQVVVGIGAKEILLHIFLATLNDGDEVIIPAPYWVSYTEQVKAAGATPVIVPMTESPELGLDINGIEKYITPKTRVIVLNSPSNPAGSILSDDDLRHVGELAKKHDLWIISDEIYEYLSFDKPHTSLLKLMPELKERYILVNGMSKGFAMTGWRVGYAVGPMEVMKLVKSLQSHSSTCLPPFIEEAATWALSQGSSLMTKEIAILKARKKVAVDCLKEIEGVDFIKPEGAFYVFVDVRKALKKSDKFKDNDTLAFGEFLLLEHHIACVPGEAFGTPGFLRFSYATNDETIREGFKRLNTALNSIT